MTAKTWVVALTLIGAALQLGAVSWGFIALRLEHKRARGVVAAAHGPHAARPEPTSTWNDVLYMREVVIDSILSHSYKQAAGALGAILLGTLLQTVAAVWGTWV